MSAATAALKPTDIAGPSLEQAVVTASKPKGEATAAVVSGPAVSVIVVFEPTAAAASELTVATSDALAATVVESIDVTVTASESTTAAAFKLVTAVSRSAVGTAIELIAFAVPELTVTVIKSKSTASGVAWSSDVSTSE